MPDINRWMAEPGKIGNWAADVEGEYRSIHFTHFLIQQKPTSIVIHRQGTGDLSAQTVRIETTRIQPDKDIGPVGRETNANAVVIGYKDHPDYDDLDIQQGDRFAYDGQRYEVRHLFPDIPGAIQAWVEVMS